MRKIAITQHNFDGQGNNRVATLWVKTDQVELTVARKMLAYNMDRTSIAVSNR